MSVFSIALFLILNDRFHLAGEWVIGGFEAKGIAYAFVLLGLNQVFRNRWNRAWPVLGIAAAFHVVVGGWAILATGIAYLLTQLIPIHPDDRRLLTTKNHESPSRQFIPLLIGFCIALIGILPPLLSEWSTAERIARQAHFVHVHERIHHHLMFESFGTMQIARFSFLIMTWAVFTGCFWNRVLFRRLNLFCAATLLVSFAGLILSGIAEPADGTGAAEFELANTATSLLRFYWFRIADFALPFGIAMATSVAITRSIKATENAASHKFAARLFCVLILAAFAFAVAHRYGDLRPLADKNSLPTYIDDPVRTKQTFQNWVKVCEWARDNTPEDAVFITPVEQQTFKWYAQRNEVASWKDTPQDADSVIIWRDRLQRVYYPQKEYDGGLLALSDEQLLMLSKDFNVDYLLIPQSDLDQIQSRTRLKQVYPMNRMSKSTYVIFKFPDR